MKVSFQQSDAAVEPIALIMARSRTSEVESAIHALESLDSHTPDNTIDMISGTFGTQNSVIPISSISVFYAADKHVFARYNKQDWQINVTLKFLESHLDSTSYVRISNSSIVNIRALVRFDINLAGSYIAVLRDSSTVKVSSRYIPTIKSRLISHSTKEKELS